MSGGVSAKEHKATLSVIDSLEARSQFGNVIIRLPPDILQSRNQRFIALDPSTQEVKIIPAKISMQKEASSFRQHTHHYIAFWSLFSAMFIMDILWAK